jgi:hypothetical protein
VASWLELRAQLPSAVVQLPEQGDTRVDANNFELGRGFVRARNLRDFERAL